MVIIKPITWRFMMATKIERVDTIPLIIGFLEKMGVQKWHVGYEAVSGFWGLQEA
jgi:hypothetical protein